MTGDKPMRLDWVDRSLSSLEKGLITPHEAWSWIVQELATAPPFDDATLSKIAAIPGSLPEEIREGFLKELRGVVAVDFVYPITTVGGHGLLGNRDNLRKACAILGLLGPVEHARLRQAMEARARGDVGT